MGLAAFGALTLNLFHSFCSTVAFQWCYLSSVYHDRISASVLLLPLLPAPFAEAIVGDSVNALDLCEIVHFRKLVELELRLCMVWCK